MITTKPTELLTASSEGVVKKINIKVGQQVHKGDVLIELDVDELQAKARNLAAGIRSAKADAGAMYAQANDAARQMALQSRLQRVGAGTAEAVRQAQAQRSQYGSSGAAAGERAAQSQTDLAEINRLIERAKIAAPFDGIVVSLRIHEGENANKGLTVARVSDPEDLRVKFTVPIEQRGKIKVGQSVEVIMPGRTRTILAGITAINEIQETRLAVMVVEADIDDSKLNPGEISPTAQGHVRLVAPGAKS